MANLHTEKYKFSGYKTIAELTGLTFTVGEKYSLQVQGVCYIREGTEGEGFLVTVLDPIDYTVESDELYFSCVGRRPFTLNVAKIS